MDLTIPIILALFIVAGVTVLLMNIDK